MKFDEVKSFLKGLPRILAEYAFLSSLVLILGSLILGGFLFYKYCFSVQKLEPSVVETPVGLKEEVCREVLEEQAVRQERAEMIGSKEYLNPFKRPVGPQTPSEGSIFEELTE